jgi:Fur family transcriptional regulator, ferric uptake regulator
MKRMTRQRQAIMQAFERHERPLRPDEVLAEAQRDVPSLSLATVYRALQDMLQEGEIDAVAIPNHPPCYELAGLKHHHHCICTDCGRVFEVAGCCYREEQNLPEGFAPEGHEVIVYGHCRECRNAKCHLSTAVG